MKEGNTECQAESQTLNERIMKLLKFSPKNKKEPDKHYLTLVGNLKNFNQNQGSYLRKRPSAPEASELASSRIEDTSVRVFARALRLGDIDEDIAPACIVSCRLRMTGCLQRRKCQTAKSCSAPLPELAQIAR